MADIKELETKRSELYATLKDVGEQIEILQAYYHEVSLSKDEVERLIDVATNGEKRIEPLTLEAVTTAVQASKVVAQPIAEPIEPVIIK